MMNFSLRDFIVTGKFGQLQLGTIRTVVLSILGRPDDYSLDASSFETAAIWRYGSAIEFHFDSDNRLEMIFSDYLSNLETSAKLLQFDPWVFKNKLSFQEVMNELDKEKIHYRTDVKNYQTFQKFLILFPSKVILESEDFNLSTGIDQMKKALTWHGALYIKQDHV